MNKITTSPQSELSWPIFMLTIIFVTMTSFGTNHILLSRNTTSLDIDVNGDGTLNILVIGTNSSINGAEAFSPNQIAIELQNILSADEAITIDVNVVAEDIHMSKPVILGLGGGGTEYTWNHHSHSLTQYYYWPEGREARMDNLSGNGNVDWDFVIIGADPQIVSTTPGYYSLGVNKIAAKVVEGDALPLLLMMWPKNETSGASIAHFEEFTYRTADGSKVPLATVPAGLAWEALSDDKKDIANNHPTPNGAYLAAATIYSNICKQNASLSDYIYDDELADLALSTVIEEENKVHYTGIRSFTSPFKSCDIGDEIINYNHTGTSSENGIKAGLNWVFNQSPKTFQNGGTSPINFNYGRANSNFEANKRYKIDPALFDFSFGFPMQDHGNHGDLSMLYGIDRRESGTLNDTDIGVAQFMIEQSELPYARAIPIRTLYAQMHEAIPGQSAYRDSWHMHRDLDKAIAAYMYTMLNGTCVVGDEPANQDSDEWRTWRSHKIGYETAWNLMYLEGVAPDCSTLLDLDGDGFNSYVDCDDNNEQINPKQTEEVYNGIDEDCNSGTPDDDIDQDGFLLAEDCDDNNADINPNQSEIAYNGIDDDCDSATPDDDLDQDGFLLADDCDDNNAAINSNQAEIAYNGIDDDCDAATLDDDLDQDGFLLEDDCNDDNPDINPNAIEIANNGIDEDCDGMDLLSSLHELSNTIIAIYPNPAINYINIDISGQLDFSTSLYDLNGRLIKKVLNKKSISVNSIPSGTFLLEIKDLKTGQKIVEKIIVGR